MLKKIFKVTILVTVFSSFISPNIYAFHKLNSKSNTIYEDEKLTKEDIAAKHCALKVSNLSNNESKETEENIKGYKINSYHSTQKKEAPKIWNFRIPLNNKLVKDHLKKLIYLETNMFLNEEQLSKPNPKGGITLENFLKIICLQYDEKERPSKFEKKSSMDKLFLKIAEKNQLLKNDKPSVKAKLSIKIYDEGLIIDEPGVVYYIPDYLIDQDNKIQVAKSNNNKKLKSINDENDWIAENKQPLLDKIDKKISEFDDQILKTNNEYDKLKINYENFVDDFKNKIVIVEDLLEDADRTQKDIKEKAKELRSNKRKFLNTDILDNLKSKFKTTKKIKGKHYNEYKSLDNLRDDVAGSNNKRKFTNKGKGYFIQWERLENSKLNIKQIDNIAELNKEIENNKLNIENKVDNLIQEIESLEEEFGSKLPWNIIIVVFLLVCGVGGLLLFNNQRLKNLQKEADKKVSSLKTDLEGQLKSTSDQLQSVASSSRSSNTQSDRQPIATEKSKTPEEIIASKFDELLSDYKDVVDDFSKVVPFKQKWNGLALSRKERQDGTKTILINSSRAFEKSEIWCLNFDNKFFAFPGSTVKSNMAAYMNLDFMKAQRDFKGVFSITSGSSFLAEPSVLRRGGAGFVVERPGKLTFPN